MKRSLLALCAVTAGACAAQEPPPAPPSTAIVDSIQAPYDMAKGYIIAAAEQVPEDLYGFQPTDDVRTMGQLFGHIADANYMMCGTSSGEEGPSESAEASATTKADLQQALADSFAFCDQAFAALDDATGAEGVTIAAINDMATTRLGVLAFNAAHDMEHYGNIVTYMRINDMVPPSSQNQGGM